MSLADHKRWIEDRAAWVVAHTCGAEPRRRDLPGGPPGMHDFDLVYPDGSVEPLEVTTAADEAVVRTQERVLADAKRWDAPLLGRHWILSAPRHEWGAHGDPVATDIRRLRLCVEPFLADLEAEGIHSFESRSAWGPTAGAQIIRHLLCLGVEWGSSIPHPAGSLEFVVVGGTGDGPPLWDVVAREARKPDNARKLLAVPARRRHLAVGVSMTQGDAWGSAHYGPSAPATGTLPEGITTVWVGALGVWHVVEPPGQWRRVDVPGDLLDALDASSPAATVRETVRERVN